MPFASHAAPTFCDTIGLIELMSTRIDPARAPSRTPSLPSTAVSTSGPSGSIVMMMSRPPPLPARPGGRRARARDLRDAGRHDVVYRQLVPRLEQVPRHGPAHDAQSDECDPRQSLCPPQLVYNRPVVPPPRLVILEGQRARLHPDPRRAGPQPQRHFAFYSPQPADRHHGRVGSGKSSLAFDTIYAEGQRRYVESLSAYARQFLERMEKPDVDDIDGIAPAVAIRQKNTTPQSALDRRHLHRVLRLPAPALRARRPDLLPELRRRASARTRSTKSPRGCSSCREGSRWYALFPTRRARRPRRRCAITCSSCARRASTACSRAAACSNSRRPNRCSISTSRSRCSSWWTASRSGPTCTSAWSTPSRSATAKRAK